MSQPEFSSERDPAGYDLRKRARRGYSDLRDTSPCPDRPTQSLTILSDFLAGWAEASAEAFRGLSSELESRRTWPEGLPEGVMAGVLRGNARFFEQLSRTSRDALHRLRASQELRREEAAEVVLERLDYERLARRLAVELKAAERSPTTTSTPRDDLGVEGLDYERLARLVAAELKAQGGSGPRDETGGIIIPES